MNEKFWGIGMIAASVAVAVTPIPGARLAAIVVFGAGVWKLVRG